MSDPPDSTNHHASSTSVRRFARNSLSRILSQGIGKLALFAWMTILARYLRPEGFGFYVYLLTLVNLLGILSDFGLGFLVTRSVARAPSEVSRYLTHSQLIRLVLGIISYAILAWLVITSSIPSDSRTAALILGLTIFSVSGINGFNAILNAREELHLSSLMTGLIPLATLIIGIGLFIQAPTLGNAVVPSVIAGGIVLLGQFVLFKSKKLSFARTLDPHFTRALIRQSAPLFVMIILATLNVCLDTLLLKHFHDDVMVGIYNASYKLILALVIVPTALGDAVFPSWSRTRVGRGQRGPLSLKNALRLLLVAGLPMSVLLTIGASTIIQTIFGASYAASATILRIHAWTLLFMFLTTPLVYRMIATDEIRRLILTSAIVLSLNCVMNLLLIPRYGGSGAAAATLLSEIVNTSVLLYWNVKARRASSQPLPGSSTLR